MDSSANALIVLAAGRGERMGGRRPKMLLRLEGKPLVYWALKNIENCPAVGTVVLAAPPGHEAAFRRNVKAWGYKKVRAVVSGGKGRTDSTRNALSALPAECRWVGIHDGARPFTDPDLIRRCFQAAKKSGAAILASACSDTLKLAAPRGRERTRRPRIEKTLPRERCWLAQTPQVFRKDLAMDMHRKPRRSATDDASIAESMGIPVEIVPGAADNIKITTPFDLPLARAVLAARRRQWR
ncbi:MAG: 2-C-methyl-D-erythritol 4-phosphate cytidylyltransferase [Elusimicrobia bacterium RIFCSPLOWO2_01_FULL_64_13]|nr:MAG: 2-C-methyl-D-erythritol 4-phosphate cytidylyltransferase [Elusimicrobia bacterium RIFCSPLOWO2_01_FULL_64_13]